MPELPLPAWDAIAILAHAADPPQIDAALVARVVSRCLHLIAAIILGGGLFYLRTVLSPAGVDACYADRRTVWARWVGVASFLLIASGMLNFMIIWSQYRDAGQKLPPTYHMLFGAKVLLAALVMFVAAILAGRTSAAERFRARLSRWLGIGWAATIAVVVIGALLRAHHVTGPQNADRGAASVAPIEEPHG